MMTEPPYLLQADFSVSSSGDTYCAVPTKELALATNNANKCLKRYEKLHTVHTKQKGSFMSQLQSLFGKEQV